MMQAPPFTLDAVVSGRRISSVPPLVNPLLLLFHGRQGADTAAAINAAVHAVMRPAHVVTIASVVDLHHAPSLLHGALTLALEAGYHRATRHLPPAITPEEAIVILPDWDGSVTHGFNMQTRTVPVGMVAIDRAGMVLESYVGPDAVSSGLRMARQLKRMEEASRAPE